MSRRRTARAAHGAAFEAPAEFGFVTGESPPPPRVGNSRVRPAKVTAKAPARLLGIVVSAAKLSIGVAVVVGISVAIAWGAHRYAVTTPRFAIRQLDVRGNRHHSGDQLAHLAGIERGQNLFAVDAVAAERKLLDDPWVRTAKIGRELPATLRIEVTERDVAAETVLEDGLYLVTPEGEPFKAAEAGDPNDLPVITGIGPRDLAIDRARAIDRIAIGLEVLREYQALPLSKVYEPEEVHLEPDGAVTLTVGKRGMTFQLGMGPFRQKLLMAARVVAKIQATGDLPGVVFLDNQAHPERVVVRMR
ncbi:MAG TPA: FtsQ-type POTRA domain-containing protein [Polyangiaceae bacterium]|nr:FtsQ-type POTRA domain-containing protein [Polyangiaceae bacterium]